MSKEWELVMRGGGKALDQAVPFEPRLDQATGLEIDARSGAGAVTEVKSSVEPPRAMVVPQVMVSRRSFLPAG
jgi:hypothetical protein